MSEPAANSVEPRGAEFLELLETKHNHVLTELDALNERIEKVLSMYANSRAGSNLRADAPGADAPAADAKAENAKGPQRNAA